MSGTLPSWIERLLGIDGGPGEGTVWSIDWAWPWPPWLTLVALAAAVVFVVFVYLRQGGTASRRYRLALAAVRLTLVGLALAMIAQMTLSLKRTGLPYVAVLLDDSLSMTIADRYNDATRGKTGARTTRWDLARKLLTERDAALLRGIADRYKLRLYRLSNMRMPGTQAPELVEQLRTLEPSAECTRLGAAVRTILDDLRGAAPAAIVILSDGVNTDGPPLAEAAALARRRGVPLFTVALGSNRPARDLKLSELLVDPVVFVDDLVPFEVKLSATGFEGRKVAVTLRRQGSPKVLARTEVTVGPDGQSQQVRLNYRPEEVGQFEYTVEAEPRKDELQTENNRQQRAVEVRKEKIRVLLADGQPRYEFRYLRNMLGRDKTIELRTMLQDADVEHAEQDATALRVFPVRRDELFAYDVIILGDIDPSLLSEATLKNLVEFVDQPAKGGAVVMIAGPRHMPSSLADTPLGRLAPVDLSRLVYPNPRQPIVEGFRMQPTELGLSSPPMQLGDTPEETRAIWEHLPRLYWLVEAPRPKPAARVLAVHPTRTGDDGRPLPLVMMQYVGAGKVVFHATDETWRWRRQRGDAVFARYWVQLIRYLSRSKLAGAGQSAVLSSDRREYRPSDEVRLRLRFADERLAPPGDDGVTVVVQQQGHPLRRVTLCRGGDRGTFETSLGRLSVGSYHAWVAAPTMPGRAPAADFSVQVPSGEFEQLQADTAALEEAAKATLGRCYGFSTARRLLGDLPAGRQVPIQSLPPAPLWNTWPVLALFLALLVGEWLLRKRGGMV